MIQGAINRNVTDTEICLKSDKTSINKKVFVYEYTHIVCKETNVFKETQGENDICVVKVMLCLFQFVSLAPVKDGLWGPFTFVSRGPSSHHQSTL